MENRYETSNIILFHSFKHHFLTNIEWLEQSEKYWDTVVDRLLKSIGGSQLDYYIGSLSVKQIKDEIFYYLKVNKLFKKELYSEWIDVNRGFRELSLSDGSVWVLRMIDKETYVHIHPARHSFHTIRIKANTLKTVLCTLLFQDKDLFDFNTTAVNTYRADYLNLPCINPTGYHKELENTFNLFMKKIKM